ncbi:MAG: alpha-xylosidase [Clostridiales bacterium]|nr:alpha-xylosidase [Clostridiales bacterium]
MRFTNGYWLMREGVTPLYAVEYSDHEIRGDHLVVYAACKHIDGLGDTTNRNVLTIQFSSPMNQVIHTEITHFAGSTAKKSERPEVTMGYPEIEIIEEEDTLIYRTGNLRAVISKRPDDWRVDYYDGEQYLTFTGYRNMACMQDAINHRVDMVEQLGLDIGEKIYGLGERFTPFVKNGQNVENWNEDGGTSSEQAYKSLPFYLSSKGYGVLVDNLGDVSFEIASEKVEFTQFSVPGETLGYYVLAGGDPKGTVSLYCDMTGKPALPPAWTFGLWLTTSFTTNYNEETTASFIEGMKERDIPLRVFHFDCFWMRPYRLCDFVWNPETFPDPEAMLQRHHERGVKICVWINSYIGQRSYLFKEGMESGYLLKREDSSIWQTDLWQGGMALVDFTNPAAVEWYCGKLRTLLKMGVDCFKTDFGERIPVTGVRWYDDSDPVSMHNRYTYLYNQAVFRLLEEERGEGEAALFARSTAVGGQKYPVHWGGDCLASYPSMAETLRGGLSLACGGYGFWSHDISGFEQTATPDLYKRWCQFGLLSSHSRLHGSSSYRVPWLFDEESCVILKEFVNLKCSLMPYLYEKAVESHETGVPMMRPMFMEYPADLTCQTLDLQYMLGDSLLVAPIFRESGEVEYYLPEGTWINYLTGERITGPGWVKGCFDYHALPLMVAPNRILAVGSCTELPDYAYNEDVTLCLSAFEDGASACVDIPDEKGNTCITAKARREGDTIYVSASGEGSWSWKQLDEELTIITA